MKKGTRLTALTALILLLPSLAISAFEKEILLGREDQWRSLQKLSHLVLKPGRWGIPNLYLEDGEYLPGPETDLLLHFNRQPLRDETGGYQVVSDATLLTESARLLGNASAAFSGLKGGIGLSPGSRTLLAPGAWWGDFSLEFWLYPKVLSDGEAIFSWSGSRWQNGGMAPQKASCSVLGRKLVWQFDNFFSTAVKLDAVTPLVPKLWHHHLLRYDSSRGLLEYLVDGIPEAVATVTENRREGGSLSQPVIGASGSASLKIGESYTGFMDELRISRAFVEEPMLKRYGGITGTAVSRIFDLGSNGARLKRIGSVYRRPGATDVYFYYRMAPELKSLEELPADWKQFAPGQELGSPQGRYLQLMIELLPDGAGEASPEVSELRVLYEPDLPPAAPAALQAFPGNGKVTLVWRGVNEEGVKGYLIYYGPEPGNYHGRGSGQGDSPVDAGKVTRFELAGLENGRLYYFSVVAYDDTQPPNRSPFSREVSARPSGIY